MEKISKQNPNNRNALVLTIGIGNKKDPEGSLYTPLLKSINYGTWDHIVLLPSQSTVTQARVLQSRITGKTVEIQPIPEEGNENDADASFAHFNEVLGELIKGDGFESINITLDFTRGTKAMSAALVLAGIANSISVIRYIQAKSGPQGSVIPGTEKFKEVRADVARAHQQLNIAKRLLLRGDFEAVHTLYADVSTIPQKLPEQLRRTIASYAHIAAIYAAWDRFDYCLACALLLMHRETVSHAGQFKPSPDIEKWLGYLAAQPASDEYKEMATYLRYLACDLLANAERRLRDGHFEDAGARWYRVLELIGQARLFERGYHNGQLDKKDQKVLEFQHKKKLNLSPNSGKLKCTLNAGRFKTARFLKYLEDPLAERLLKEGDKDYVQNRNHGLLAHGFSAKMTELSSKEVDTLKRELEQLLCEDNPAAKEWLAMARSLDFSRSLTDVLP